jgi:hypothetical protein
MSYHKILIIATLRLLGDLPSCLGSSIFSRDLPSCRYLPGDDGWPSPQEWDKLNTTVHGQLIATVPLGSACHDPTYNAKECAQLQEGWLLAQTQ